MTVSYSCTPEYYIENSGAQSIGPTILLAYHGLDSSMYSGVIGASPSEFQDTVGYNETGPTGDYFVQFPDGMLAPGQSITQNVGFYNPNNLAIAFTPQVFILGPPTVCAISQNGSTVVDAQLIVNQALGVTLPANDLNSDGAVNLVDVQIVLNAVLGLGCSAS